MLHTLVIGYGSIGRRHAQILSDLGCAVCLVSRQTVTEFPTHPNLAQALENSHPDYVVIANATADHIPTLRTLAEYGFCGIVLVEKPLGTVPEDFSDLPFAGAYVGYNLRFHPLLQQLHDHIAQNDLVQFSAHCGQHLSTWRLGDDWLKSYSAFSQAGGGVLRDLSHELDYTLWLLNGWSQITALGGNLGVLGIDADEAWSILMRSPTGCLAQISVNYLDPIARRFVRATTSQSVCELDFIAQTLTINDTTYRSDLVRDDTYTDMHRAALAQDTKYLCTLQGGVDVNKMISAVELSAAQQNWILA